MTELLSEQEGGVSKWVGPGLRENQVIPHLVYRISQTI